MFTYQAKMFLALCKLRTIEFFREPSAFFWVVFMPVLWMSILGFALNEPKKAIIPLATTQSASETAAYVDFFRAINQQDIFTIRSFLEESDYLTALRNGKVLGRLLFGANAEGQPSVTVEFDPSHPMGGFIKPLVESLTKVSDGVMTFEEKLISVPGSRYVDFLIPGLLALSILTSSLFGVGMSLVLNRREGVFKRYLCTPMPPSLYLLSHVYSRALVLVVEFIAVVGAGYLIFKFVPASSFIIVFLLALLGAATFTSLAFLLASRTESIPLMGAYANLFSVISILLGGVFFSIEGFPFAFQSVISYLPLTTLVSALRTVMLDGSLAIQFEVMVLSSWFFIFLALAFRRFRWY